MMLYTAAINGVFAFLIVGGLLFTRNGVTSEFLLNLLFYIIITPVISLTLTRIMYMSEMNSLWQMRWLVWIRFWMRNLCQKRSSAASERCLCVPEGCAFQL